MMTVWADKMDPEHVLEEYPRPQLKRDSYLNLNGYWDYAITSSDEMPSSYDGKILVPFSPEAPLSGVGHILQKDEYLWYNRHVVLPDNFKKGKIYLHFGAVDREASVFINGKDIYRHEGGYLPFSVDITDYIGSEFTLSLCVTDDTDASFHTRGKQSTRSGGIWYTPQSGIWQTVWMESVPNTFIRSLRYTPYLKESEIGIYISTNIPCACVIHLNGKLYTVISGKENRIKIPEVRYWSPEDPYLYSIEVVAGEDRVESYFAMRSYSIQTDRNGIPRLCLNDKPYFHKGVLDQGYWPDGLYTAPSDEAMIYDIGQMKRMGFNMLRKHIKVEPLRWYYHCDRLGMLVWQDMPNGGKKYLPAIVSAPLITGIHLSDKRYKLFAREEEYGRREFIAELREMIGHLYSCPCIAMWVPFNEGWGQFDADRIVSLIKEMDKTRTVDQASGWHDQNGGDVKSLHVYFKPYHYRSYKGPRATVLSEFGGYHLSVAEHCWPKKRFGYRACRDTDQYNRALKKLFYKQIIPAVSKGLSATVYTQLSDVEGEVNGLMTYDRYVIKPDSALMREINRDLTLDRTSY